MKSVLDEFSSLDVEKPIYVFRELHFGKGVNVDPMENVVFSPRCKSPKIDGKIVPKSNLRSETTAYIYGWYGIESTVADQIFRKLDDELQHHSDNILLENLFKEP